MSNPMPTFDRYWLNQIDNLLKHANEIVGYMVNNTHPSRYFVTKVRDVLLVDNRNGVIELIDAEEYYETIDGVTRDIMDVENTKIIGVSTTEDRRGRPMTRTYHPIHADIQAEVFRRLGKVKTYHTNQGEGSFGPDPEDLLIGLTNDGMTDREIATIFDFFEYDLPATHRHVQELQDAEKKSFAPGLVEIE